MHRVGTCPRCGAPIYAPSISGHTAPQPVTYTCSWCGAVSRIYWVVPVPTGYPADLAPEADHA